MNVLFLLFLFALSKITELTELDNFLLSLLRGCMGRVTLLGEAQGHLAMP